MEILLIRDVPDLGQRGDLVHVAKGYYRNYLGPQGLAILATPGNRKRLADEEKHGARRNQRLLGAAQVVAERLAGLVLEFPMQASEDGHLYGSVTVQAIHKELEAKGFALETRAIRLAEPIKQLGDYEVPLVLHHEVSATIGLRVLREA